MRIRSEIVLLGILVLGLFLVSFTFNAVAEGAREGEKYVDLEKGENIVILEKGIFVRDLIFLNPEVETVVYYDSFLNKEIGYVNTLGGLGSNFLMEPGQEYEISVQEDITLRV